MLKILLRLTAIAYFGVCIIHLALGIRAEELLGAKLDVAVLSNATLDSQSRFYGTAFGLSGLLIWIASSRIETSGTIIKCLMLALFAGGLARLLSIALLGMPSSSVLFLLATEILMPPLVIFLQSRAEPKNIE
jgi:hypothetical protein